MSYSCSARISDKCDFEGTSNIGTDKKRLGEANIMQQRLAPLFF
jgi:hypothetical protein